MRFLLLCLIAALPLCAQPASDDAALRDLVAKYVAARDQIDPRAIESLFTPDADQLVSSGEWRKGRPQVVKGTVASSQSSSGKRTITVESIRMIGNDVAIVDGRYEIAATTPGGENRRMWTSLVARRTPEGWRIAAIRNM